MVVKRAAPPLADRRGFLIDLDGVLYRGQETLPGAGELLAFLERTGRLYRLVTNDSRRLAAQYVERLAGMGMPVPDDAVVTAGETTAVYLRRVARPGARVLAIGGEGLVRPLLAHGFHLDEERPEWVVVGLDIHVTYAKLLRAMQAIDRGAGFIGTNPDRRFPLEHSFAPGCGALLAFLEAATGRAPHIVGKPNSTMVDIALERIGVAPAMAAFVGDSLGTDIAAGRAAGLCTVLILTGVTTAEEAAAIRGTEYEPDYVFDNLPALIAALKETSHALGGTASGG